jgi:hypothetical protein
LKILVFSNSDGNVGLINEVLERHDDVDLGISLGDMCIFSDSSPVRYFMRSKYLDQAKSFIDFNKNKGYFSKPIYTLFGSIDDPFVPKNELMIPNLIPIWHSIMDFVGYNESRTTSKNIKCGFLSGYLNTRDMHKRNRYREKMSREKKSLAICYNDFDVFNRQAFDVLFTYEAPPSGYPYSTNLMDSSAQNLVSKLFDNSYAKRWFYGHLRQSKVIETPHKIICGLPALMDGYAIYDLFTEQLITFNTKDGKYETYG